MSKTQGEIQLASLLDQSDPVALLAEVERCFRYSFPRKAFKPIAASFAQASRLFAGLYPGYAACNTGYHDWAHTMAVFLASARLADGCALSGKSVGERGLRVLLAAALLHDAGYIQERGDREGTGAKYTKVHVERSAAFTRVHAADFGLDGAEAESAARIILGTELGRDWATIPFAGAEEILAAQIVAAADLLGQMADRIYLEKLLFLYWEFKEAGFGGYDCAFDILRKTLGFYASTRERLDGLLGAVSCRSREHFAARLGLDKDLYGEAIARQMAYLEGIMADDSSNFRAKLKRVDLAALESSRAKEAPAPRR